MPPPPPVFAFVDVPAALLVVVTAPLPLAPPLPPAAPPPNTGRSLGSCICPSRPLRLIPWPRPPISPVMTKIPAIGWLGVRHASRLRAVPRCGVSALIGPSPWWGTASSIPCSCTGPINGTQCTVGQHFGTHTPWRTGPWWSRSSVRCNCNTAQPARGPICQTDYLPYFLYQPPRGSFSILFLPS